MNLGNYLKLSSDLVIYTIDHNQAENYIFLRVRGPRIRQLECNLLQDVDQHQTGIAMLVFT